VTQGVIELTFEHRSRYARRFGLRTDDQPGTSGQAHQAVAHQMPQAAAQGVSDYGAAD
jgi:hypothetical protein